MPTIESSVKIEAQAEPCKIRLILSGEFCRAYNRSAWLFYSCISRYKVIRKFSKALQKDVYFLGFPVSKLLDLINGRNCVKTDFGYDVSLEENEIPNEEEYEAWVNEIPTEMASRANAAAIPISGKELEMSVCKKIREFPLETKTPVEALVFLSEIRKLLIEDGAV